MFARSNNLLMSNVKGFLGLASGSLKDALISLLVSGRASSLLRAWKIEFAFLGAITGFFLNLLPGIWASMS